MSDNGSHCAAENSAPQTDKEILRKQLRQAVSEYRLIKEQFKDKRRKVKALRRALKRGTSCKKKSKN